MSGRGITWECLFVQDTETCDVQSTSFCLRAAHSVAVQSWLCPDNSLLRASFLFREKEKACQYGRPLGWCRLPKHGCGVRFFFLRISAVVLLNDASVSDDILSCALMWFVCSKMKVSGNLRFQESSLGSKMLLWLWTRHSFFYILTKYMLHGYT